MKFIHLSDLHIGKRVNEMSMLEDQEHILREILNIIDEESPDAVICQSARQRYSSSAATMTLPSVWRSARA